MKSAKGRRSGSQAIAKRAMKYIRKVKDGATGKVFKALHVCEGSLAVATGAVRYAAAKPRKKRAKKKS